MRNKMRRILTMAAAVMAVMMQACTSADIHNGKTPVAKVYDTYLYYEDLGDLVPKGTDPIDSALKVKQYVHVWARQQLMIKVAELYLDPAEKDVERQLEEYRNNLLIYRYKDQYINKNLDTAVTAAQSQEYYDSHPDDFKLNSPAVKAIYVQLPAISDYDGEIRKLLDFRSEKDSLMLLELCRQHAAKFDNFDNRWVSLQEAARNMPDPLSEKNDVLRTNGTVLTNNGEYIYMLKVRDHIAAGGQMPFDMAGNNIYQIIINKRKTKLINDFEQHILDDALSSKNLEYFAGY